MNTTGNTIFITGGGSGIGRGLAEAFHKLGNTVIISGRRKAVLDEVTAANPGIQSVELDIQKPESIAKVAKHLAEHYPSLNVLVNNSGIAKLDDLSGEVDDELLTSTIETNVYGPVRLTSALLPLIKRQESGAIINVTSGLAFTPLAAMAIYCSTKAALHSLTQSLRFKLKDTKVKVLEIAPPYVQTELGGERQKTDPRAMPLEDFIAETVQLLQGDSDEILVEKVLPLRNNAGPDEEKFVTQFNEMMAGHYEQVRT